MTGIYPPSIMCTKMKAAADSNSLEYKRDGIRVLIRPTIKDGIERFVVDYRVKGQRKLVWRSTLTKARATASDAIDKIVAGQSEVLELTNTDAHVYLRARDLAATIDMALDLVARDHVEAKQILAGRATVLEACRDWVKRHDVRLPSKTVGEACDDCMANAKADGKSRRRTQQLEAVFNRLKADVNVEVAEVTPNIISKWLAGLELSERTRRNYRDAVGFLCRFCVLRGYLFKGTDWLENVQNYSARKLSEIEIYTPEELARLIEQADDGMLPFIVISAFAGLRHAEVARLDWSEIDLDDGFIEVRAAKSKTGERRLVPIHDNLKQWLLPLRQARGKVVPYVNTTKQLLKIAKATGRKADDEKGLPEIKPVEWKHNALRHSAISYRVAESADVPRVSDECGNSPQMIRQHYLRRVKPAEAARWFSIAPATEQGKIVQFKTAP